MFYLKLALTLQGYAYCIPECTCVYRFGVAESVTTRWEKEPSAFLYHSKAYVLMYQEFDRITGGEYNEILIKRILEWEYNALLKTDDYLQLRNPRFLSYARQQGLSFYVKHCVRCYFPMIRSILRKTRNAVTKQ